MRIPTSLRLGSYDSANVSIYGFINRSLHVRYEISPFNASIGTKWQGS